MLRSPPGAPHWEKPPVHKGLVARPYPPPYHPTLCCKLGPLPGIGAGPLVSWPAVTNCQGGNMAVCKPSPHPSNGLKGAEHCMASNQIWHHIGLHSEHLSVVGLCICSGIRRQGEGTNTSRAAHLGVELSAPRSCWQVDCQAPATVVFVTRPPPPRPQHHSPRVWRVRAFFDKPHWSKLYPSNVTNFPPVLLPFLSFRWDVCYNKLPDQTPPLIFTLLIYIFSRFLYFYLGFPGEYSVTHPQQWLPSAVWGLHRGRLSPAMNKNKMKPNNTTPFMRNSKKVDPTCR